MYADYRLTLRDDGVAELEANGHSVWTSDGEDAEDLAERLGKDGLNLRKKDMGKVLEYLVEEGILSDEDADFNCLVSVPGDQEDEDGDEDEEDEDEEEEEE